MDLQVFRDGKLLKTPPIVANPIDEESQTSFVQQIVHSLALWGNAYVKVYGDPVSSVEVLDPDTVVVSRDELTGKVQYWLNGKLQPKGKIRHLKFERMPGALLGHGPLQGCAGELKAAQQLDAFQQTWFNTDGIPKGILTSTTNVNAAQQKQLIEAFEAFIKDHKNVLLPLGIKYETLAVKPIELQYVDVAEANIRNIARIFGIPAANLLTAIEGTSMTYTNYVESNMQFMQNTLSRYMNEIEDFLSSLLPRGQKVQFNEEMLLRMSPEKAWTIIKTKVDIGYTSGDELRAEEGKKPLPKPVVKSETQNQTNPNKDNQENGNT
ncbi:phage portal protein [Rhodococcus wratislaviensis]|uniref:Phage portal protein n=2 Tax=Rhodococcus wratislaviensis TaxID=44752 RepID=A0AB38FJ77_RHOWR|nr:phage portal protein [Rhodococcus wratislaviensis]